MRYVFSFLILSILWCNASLAGEVGGVKEVGTDQKCFDLFERENIFKEKFLPLVDENKGAIVFYIGCSKEYDNWGWWESTNIDLDKAHERAYRGCVEEQISKYNLTGCHLFSINDVIVWNKDSTFIARAEKDVRSKITTTEDRIQKQVENLVVMEHFANPTVMDVSCYNRAEKIFKKDIKPKIKKKNVTVFFMGCTKDGAWQWQSLYDDDLEMGAKKGYEKCLKSGAINKIKDCYLFSIDKLIVWDKHKDVKFKDKINKKYFAKAAKNKKSRNYVHKFLLDDDIVFSKKDLTTFKKLTFDKERNLGTVKKEKRGGDWKKKKSFKSFSFIAEYEENITVDIHVEYKKDYKSLEHAKREALFFARMYGQMPYFLKDYNKTIYIHNDWSFDYGGLWWVNYEKRAFHINNSRQDNGDVNCQTTLNNYSKCAVTMVHELGHVVHQLTGVISPSKWAKARKLDKKKYCSEYSKKNNKEDFAESVVCCLIVKYKSDKISKNDLAKFKEFIPHRLKFFDKLNFNVHPL